MTSLFGVSLQHRRLDALGAGSARFAPQILRLFQVFERSQMSQVRNAGLALHLSWCPAALAAADGGGGAMRQTIRNSQNEPGMSARINDIENRGGEAGGCERVKCERGRWEWGRIAASAWCAVPLNYLP